MTTVTMTKAATEIVPKNVTGTDTMIVTTPMIETAHEVVIAITTTASTIIPIVAMMVSSIQNFQQKGEEETGDRSPRIKRHLLKKTNWTQRSAFSKT